MRQEWLVDFGDNKSSRFVELAMVESMAHGAKMCQRIVRCKDCFWFNENATPNDEDRPHFCHKLGIDLKDGNGFCAWSHKEGA